MDGRRRASGGICSEDQANGEGDNAEEKKGPVAKSATFAIAFAASPRLAQLRLGFIAKHR
jgi:hypothetical protein